MSDMQQKIRYIDVSTEYAKVIAKNLNAPFLDSNNILWKTHNSEWIGKRSVWTFDFRACWLEDTDISNVKSWWCGKDADYNEIFR